MPDTRLFFGVNKPLLIGQFIRFSVVGLLAAALHYGLALAAVNKMGLSVALANLLAFLCAFWVSFFGHHYFSFKVSRPATAQSAGKFFVVAALGFVLNETLVVSLTYFKWMPLTNSLAFAIVVTAVFTFILNRQFAFKVAFK